jgi:hypothetical protein
MGIRESLNNPVVAGVVIVVVLATVAAIWTFGGDARPLDGYGYFFDLDRRETFVMQLPDEVPPVQTADGTTAVRAVMFGCGGCDEAATRSVAYLEMWLDSAKQALKNPVEVPAEEARPGVTGDVAAQREAGHMIARLPQGESDPQWVPVRSPAGQEIMLGSSQLCAGGKQVHECSPLASELP